jgi:hypothetical protein
MVGPFEGNIWCPCLPKEPLTPEEEAILAKMREIREQAHPITERLGRIRLLSGASPADSIPEKDQDEWNALSARLQDLRAEWKKWRKELEEANERKLVLLGHLGP